MSVDASAWGLNVVSLSPGDFPPNLRFPAPLISILLCLALPHTQFLPPKLPPRHTQRQTRSIFSSLLSYQFARACQWRYYHSIDIDQTAPIIVMSLPEFPLHVPTCHLMLGTPYTVFTMSSTQHLHPHIQSLTPSRAAV